MDVCINQCAGPSGLAECNRLNISAILSSLKWWMGRTIKMWWETMALAAAYSLYSCCAQLKKQFLSNPMLMYAGFVIYAPWGYLSRDFHVLTRIVIQSLLTVIPYMASCRQLLLSLFYSFGYSFIILLYHLLTRTFIFLSRFLEPILPRNVICLTWNCRSILSLHGKTIGKGGKQTWKLLMKTTSALL